MYKTIIFLAAFLAAQFSMGQTFISHRGANRLAPENSIEAFKKAFELGAKYVEGDFWITKSGDIICIHDKGELKSLAGIDKSIPDLTSEDLATADLSANNKWRGKHSSVRIPALEGVMKCVPQNGIFVFEIKNYNADFAKKFEATRKKTGLKKGQVLLISFNADWLADAAKQIEHSGMAWIYWLEKREGKLSPSAEEAVKTCRRIGANAVDIGNVDLLTKEYVKALHDANIAVYVWTVNDGSRAVRLFDIGVDAITTDAIDEML